MTPELRAEYVKRLCPMGNPDAVKNQKTLKECLELMTASESTIVLIPVDMLREIEAYFWLLENEIHELSV